MRCSEPSPSPSKSFLHKFLGLPTEEGSVLEGAAAPQPRCPGAARFLELSQTEACAEVYRFSKAFDNVKLLGDEVGGEHTAAM